MRNNNQKKNNHLQMWPVLILLMVVLTAVVLLLPQDTAEPPAPTNAPATDAPTDETTGDTVPPMTFAEPVVKLGRDLQITDLGSYAGIYMEDGTNEPVTNVMMLVLHNAGNADLQYLELELTYEGRIYSFKATNLAAGSAAVLLEQERQPYPGGEPDEAAVRHAAFFDEPMTLCTDVLQISGMEGALNVKNISDRDIAGDIYIYYKYCSTDLLYGGITFRARVPGLQAGAIYQVPTGHYSPDSCVIVQVTMVG